MARKVVVVPGVVGVVAVEVSLEVGGGGEVWLDVEVVFGVGGQRHDWRV